MLNKSIWRLIYWPSLWLLALISCDLFSNEYVVKVLNQKSARKQLATVGSVRVLNLSFGNYFLLKSKLSLQQLRTKFSKSPEFTYFGSNHVYRALPYLPINEVENDDSKWWQQLSPTGEGSPDLLNDPLFERQWGMQNNGSNARYNVFFRGRPGEDLQILPVWQQGIVGNRQIKVAVLDTGIDYHHPDLQDNLWINQAEYHGLADVDDDLNGFVDDIYGYNFFDNHGDPMDKNGHGTHCAGVIGAVHNNGIGVAGVMGEVQLVAIKFLGGWMGSGTTLGAIAAIDYAIKMGVDVMSNSWGGESDEHDLALMDAIKAANEKGIVFVVAAGNASTNNDLVDTMPANVKADNVISVGAFMAKGSLASFSNYGEQTVHVMAPGTNILSTYKGGGYRKLSGTSMACPHVAGLVGLLRSVAPELTPAQVRGQLISTSSANSVLDNFSISRGRVDASKLLLEYSQHGR